MANFSLIALTVDEDAGRTSRSLVSEHATLPEALAALEAVVDGADGYEIKPGSDAAAEILQAYCNRLVKAKLEGTGPF